MVCAPSDTKILVGMEKGEREKRGGDTDLHTPPEREKEKKGDAFLRHFKSAKPSTRYAHTPLAYFGTHKRSQTAKDQVNYECESIPNRYWYHQSHTHHGTTGHTPNLVMTQPVSFFFFSWHELRDGNIGWVAELYP